MYEETVPLSNFAEQLVWLADSSFINGQSHRFRRNVLDWIEHRIYYPIFIEHFKNIETIDFEYQVQNLQKIMVLRGFEKGHGQVLSRHLGLSGFQCQPSLHRPIAIKNYIMDLLSFVEEITGWFIKNNQIDFGNLEVIEGFRKSDNISIINVSLDNFLDSKSIFSYVFPFRDKINWTSKIF